VTASGPAPLDDRPTGEVASATARPRRWKSLLVTFAVVFPTVQVLNRGVAPHLGALPSLLRDVLMVATMSVVLSYLLPLANRRLHRWLAE
jgi:antibiotic biosynthesis monooxygenase (ABM) superfamily enzyme